MFPISIYQNTNDIPSIDDDNEDIRYIVTKNGLYLRKGSPGIFKAQIPVQGCGILQELKPEVFLELPLIKPEEYMPVFAFFYKIYTDLKTEVEAFIYYNKERGYKFFVPFQKVSGASVKSIGATAQLDGGYLRVGTIHSHCNMSLGHSGTDVNDEKYFDGIHIITERLSLVSDGKIELTASVVVNGVRIKLEPETLFDIKKAPDEIKTYTSPNYGAYYCDGVFVYDTENKEKKEETKSYTIKNDKAFFLPYNIEEVEFDAEWLKRVDATSQIPKSYVKYPNTIVPYRTSGKNRNVISLKDYQQKVSGTVEMDPCSVCPFKGNKERCNCDTAENNELITDVDYRKIDGLLATQIRNQQIIDSMTNVPESGVGLIKIFDNDEKLLKDPPNKTNNHGFIDVEYEEVLVPTISEYENILFNATKKGLIDSNVIDLEMNDFLDFLKECEDDDVESVLGGKQQWS